MKQTAVEWLEEKLIEAGLSFKKGEAIEIEKAKEMEKQQIIDAYNKNPNYFDSAEQYYNETFKK